MHLLHVVISSIFIFKTLFCLLLGRELDKDIAYHVIAYIISNKHFNQLAIFAEFGVDLSVELFTVRSSS
jgi:hypothetical protein